MFRKTILALAAIATVGAAALAPTSASAGWHGGHHWGHGWGHGFGYGYGIGLYNTYASDCYIVKKVVDTDFGPRVRRVTVCN
jgi:hypothetical protein